MPAAELEEPQAPPVAAKEHADATVLQMPPNDSTAAALTSFASAVLAATTALNLFVQQSNGVSPDATASTENANAPTRADAPPPPSPNGEARTFQRQGGISQFKAKIDSAESSANSRNDGTDEYEALLQRAITILDKLTSQRGPGNSDAMQQQLNNIEQRLASGAYPQ